MATIKGNAGNNNLTGTTGNDFIYGYDGLDTLTGLAGNDRLEAGNGNDTLDGGSGADTMIGGSGDDTYLVDHASDVIVEVPGEGVDTISTSISYTLVENYVNNLTLIGSSNLNGIGNSYNNVITGNSANNLLNGGAGIDTLIGGKGDDTYIVDSTSDVILEVPGEGVDTIVSSVTYTLSENYLNNVWLTGVANLNATGNSYGNVIEGNEGNNLLFGGDGNDTIYGGQGFDTIYGEKGNDYLSGGDYYLNFNALIYGGDGNDTLGGVGLMYGEAGNDVITPGEYGTAYGGAGNDTLSNYQSASYGDAGNDSITGSEFYGNGGDGNDFLKGGDLSFLEGGKGNDTLTCFNEGEHTLIFKASNEGMDTIIGFDGFTDGLQVSALGFGGGLKVNSVITSKQFAYGTRASNASQRFLYDTSKGDLRFDVDGSGLADSTVLAIFQGAPSLAYTDIYIFS